MFSWIQDYFNLTQEKGKDGKDYLFKSEWQCEKAVKYNLLAVYKPFKEKDIKIWDMTLAVILYYVFTFMVYLLYLV